MALFLVMSSPWERLLMTEDWELLWAPRVSRLEAGLSEEWRSRSSGVRSSPHFLLEFTLVFTLDLISISLSMGMLVMVMVSGDLVETETYRRILIVFAVGSVVMTILPAATSPVADLRTGRVISVTMMTGVVFTVWSGRNKLPDIPIATRRSRGDQEHWNHSHYRLNCV